MKKILKATIVSKTLGTWGFHYDSVGTDVEVEIEFHAGDGLATRQRLVVYHSVDLDNGEPAVEGVNARTLSDITVQLVEEIGGKVDDAVEAVLYALGAELSDNPIPELGLKPLAA